MVVGEGNCIHARSSWLELLPQWLTFTDCLTRTALHCTALRCLSVDRLNRGVMFAPVKSITNRSVHLWIWSSFLDSCQLYKSFSSLPLSVFSIMDRPICVLCDFMGCVSGSAYLYNVVCKMFSTVVRYAITWITRRVEINADDYC